MLYCAVWIIWGRTVIIETLVGAQFLDFFRRNPFPFSPIYISVAFYWITEFLTDSSIVNSSTKAQRNIRRNTSTLIREGFWVSFPSFFPSDQTRYNETQEGENMHPNNLSVPEICKSSTFTVSNPTVDNEYVHAKVFPKQTKKWLWWTSSEVGFLL